MTLHKTRNPLAAYSELPHGVSFDDQKPTEEVKLLLRQHIITNLKWVLGVVAAALLPTLLYEVRSLSLDGMNWLSGIPFEVWETAALLWYVGVVGFALEAFFIWYYSVYLVTNYRVVDTDFNGLLHYTSTEAAMHQIQDVTHRQSGVWQLLFNYGNVRVQTAGSTEDITFERVPKPARVADVLTDLLPKPDDYTYPDSLPVDERKTLPREELYAQEKPIGATVEKPKLSTRDGLKVQRGQSRKEY